jgi:hypothetical protein
VDLVGIEPTTSSMPWKRAPSCATGPKKTLPILADYDEIVKPNINSVSPTIDSKNCPEMEPIT